MHGELQYLREDVYELVSYMRQEEIAHFVAHPFFRMGSALNMDDFEKILLLFNIIEVKNGGKQLSPNDLLERIIGSLSPGLIWDLAEKHNLLPYGRVPWLKSMVAGSDDHGGILIASPHTICPYAAQVSDLLHSLHDRKCRLSPENGDALPVAHHVYAVVHSFAKGHSEMSAGTFP